ASPLSVTAPTAPDAGPRRRIARHVPCLSTYRPCAPPPYLMEWGRRCDMLLFVNLFADGGALLETGPQGDASYPVQLPPVHAEPIRQLLTSDGASAALARLFLAGAGAGERAVRKGKPA